MIIFGQAEITFLTIVVRPIVIGAIFGIIVALVRSSFEDGEHSYKNKVMSNIFPAIGYSIPVVCIGYIAGYLTGISRSPAVGSIVPAVLVLIGGLNIYFFGIDSKNRVLVGYCIFVFSLTFFYGVWGGVVDRENGRLGRLLSISEQEKNVRTYRENRGLPAEIPSWILPSGEPR
jgi:hypothetical protein